MASIQISADTVATAFKAWTVSDAGARWKIARDILSLVDGSDDKSRAEAVKTIGVKCAEAIGRTKINPKTGKPVAHPYAPSWVRLVCAAARKYPTKPTTPSQCADFLTAINGNGSKKNGAAKTEMTADDALKMFKSIAKSAMKKGCDAEALSTALAEVIDAAGATV